MTTSETVQKALSVSDSAVISGIIGRTIIIEWGTVEEVLGDGSVVNVMLSVTDRAENATIVTCTLISPCSKNLSVNITPSVGDKVLVLSPRFFDHDMFDVTDNTEVIVQPNAKGYNKMSCLAILYNQFRESTHKNSIDFTDGKLDMKLAYNESQDKNLIEVSASEEGDINIKNPKATVTIDKDGNVKVNAEGKYTFKNGVTDMYKVVDGLAKEVENLTTQGSPGAQATSPASKASISTWRSSQLNQLMESE
jgi:hypothetical protein